MSCSCNQRGSKMKTKFTGLVLDTETHFKSEHNKLIYDIGWVMGDLRNATAPKIERRFFVKEFLPLSFWKHTFVNKETGNRQFWKIDSRAEQTQRHAFDEPSMVKSWDFIRTFHHYMPVQTLYVCLLTEKVCQKGL